MEAFRWEAKLSRQRCVSGLPRSPEWLSCVDPRRRSHSLASPPPLSSTQQAELDKWVPAAAAFPHAPLYADGSGGREITQDNVADCSVVTALIVAAEHHRKFRSRVSPA